MNNNYRSKRNWFRLTPKYKEFKRCDYNYEESYISDDSFRLCKMSTSEGKWLLFSPLDKFLGRMSYHGIPEVWANTQIDKEMK